MISVLAQIRWPRLWTVCGVLLTATMGLLLWADTLIPFRWFPQPPDVLIFGLTAALACDICVVAILRRSLRRQAISISTRPVLPAAIGQLVLAFLATSGLLWLGGLLIRDDVSHRVVHIGHGLVLAAASNTLGAALCLSLNVVSVVFGLHKLAWPLIERPVYLIGRLGMFRTVAGRAAIFGLGAALVAIGLGRERDVVGAALRLIGSA